MRRSVVATVLVLLGVGALSHGAAAASPPGGSDISRSPRGRALAAEAAARFTVLGFATRAGELRVTTDLAGGYLVAPKRSTAAATGRAGGSVVTRSGAAGRAGVQSTASTAATSGWRLVADDCFARYSHSAGWMDTCYHLNKLFGDSSTSFDYFGLHVFATAYCCDDFPGFGNSLKAATIQSTRHGGSTQSWHQWVPGSDSDVACRTQGLGISAFGFGVTYSHEHCEMWDITKYAEPGRFRNTWRGQVDQHEREVAYHIAVRVPQGGWAQWLLEWSFTAG